MEPAGLLARGAEFHDQIAAVDETTLAQFITERRIAQGDDITVERAAKKPDAINAPSLLRGERCGRRAAAEAAAPPSSVMNSRLFTRSPRRHERAN